MQSGNYQDNVIWPLLCNYNDSVIADVNPDVIDVNLDPNANIDPAICVLPIVEKV